MTCIVGLVHKNRVYMGADSAGVDGLRLSLRADRKIFTLNDGKIILGFTSSFRMGQILQYQLKITAPDPESDIDKWIHTEFVESVREVMGKYGFRSKKDERESGGTFLLGMFGRLFCVYDDFQVAVSQYPFNSCGCGVDIANGSLFSTQGSNIDPKRRIILALEAASSFSAGVRKPFVLIDGTENPCPPEPEEPKSAIVDATSQTGKEDGADKDD